MPRLPHRSRLSSLGYLPLLLLLAIACGEGVSSNGADASGGGGGGGLLCSANTPCADGQFCFNGVCAIGCNSNGDCAENQYCDTEFDRLCHNKVVQTCPDTPCNENQTCQDGFCSATPTNTSCEPRADGNDGCPNDSLCLENDAEETQCYGFPACPEDGICPTGTIGAVCNAGIIPNKGHICLTSLCQTVDHCPASWSCIKEQGGVVGSCSDGNFGSLCIEQSDCNNGQCSAAAPGLIGFCL